MLWARAAIKAYVVTCSMLDRGLRSWWLRSCWPVVVTACRRTSSRRGAPSCTKGCWPTPQNEMIVFHVYLTNMQGWKQSKCLHCDAPLRLMTCTSWPIGFQIVYYVSWNNACCRGLSSAVNFLFSLNFLVDCRLPFTFTVLCFLYMAWLSFTCTFQFNKLASISPSSAFWL